jgi:4-hydroxybenzoate polyprenyltransferase
MIRTAAMLTLLRPQQWIKNGFVLLGWIFGHSHSQLNLLPAVCVGFFAFCFASSAIYVFNDYHDRAADARHPQKQRRPIASGQVGLPLARGLIAALFFSALLLPIATGKWAILLVILAYLALNIAYTLLLKKKVLIDVFCIVAGFMLRVVCGTYAIGIAASDWLLLCAFMLTLFLGFAKRRAEIEAVPACNDTATCGSTRIVLRQYSTQLLDILVTITASTTLITYGLYTVDLDTAALHGTKNLMVTLPIVTFGIFRYLYLLYNKPGCGEEPGRDILSDRQTRLAVLAWLLTVLAVVGT